MQRGNLVIYDNNGVIFSQTGEAEGDILPHQYPVGLPYLEIPFGTIAFKRIIGIDVTKIPHEPIFEDANVFMTQERLRIIELETQLLIAEGVI